MNNIYRFITGLVIAAAFATFLPDGYAIGLSDSFYPDFTIDPDLAGSFKERNILNSGVQYGLWIGTSYIDDQDGKKRLATSVTTARPWLKFSLWNNSYLYARGKYTLTSPLYEKGYNLKRFDHLVDLDVGEIRAWIPNRMLDISVGRKFFLLGSGLLFNGRGDGLEIDFYSRWIGFKAFGAYTGFLLKDDNPYGLSDKDISTGARRIFGAGQIFTSFYNQTLYVMGMLQYDLGKESPYVSTLYYSYYLAAGIRGLLFEHLEYNAEFINERGKSFISGWSKLNNINAMAAIINLNCYFNAMLNPVLTAQYAWGSGDRDRDNYRLPNGNANGADNGFLYFGTYQGGYALRPLLANIHVFRFGGSFTPFSWAKVRNVKDISITAKYSYYMKHKNIAPINYGSDAPRNQREIGHGVDVQLRWLVISDVSVYANYGLFIPGDAYGNKPSLYGQTLYASTKNKHFIMAGLNMNI